MLCPGNLQVTSKLHSVQAADASTWIRPGPTNLSIPTGPIIITATA